MSSHSNLDNCECEANLFLKKYRSKIEALFKDERESLKKIAHKTSDYGTFKGRGQGSIEDVRKIKKGAKATKQSKKIEKPKLTDRKDGTQTKTVEKSPEIIRKNAEQTKTVEKSSVVSRKNAQQTKTVEKSKVIDVTDARQTKPAEKLKVTESKGKLQLDQDKRNKSKEGSRSPTQVLEEPIVADVLSAEDSRISVQEEKLRSQIKIQEVKLEEEEKELELLKEKRSEQRIEVEQLDISKDKLTTDEESIEKEISPNEYPEITKDQDKPSELEKEDSVVIIYEKEPRQNEEELKDKQNTFKSKIDETLKYFHEQRIDCEEYDAEKDYSKTFSKPQSSEVAVDNFLFNPPDMHLPDGIVSDSQKQAEDYLKTHKIYQFFHFLLSHLVAENSSHPISYLIWLLNECIRYRAKCCEPPLLFEKKHIESLFNSMDPMQTGFISVNQYHTGMMTLGIGIYRKRPALTKDSMVGREQFIHEALTQLTYQLDEMIKTTAQPSTTTFTSYESGSSTPYG